MSQDNTAQQAYRTAGHGELSCERPQANEPQGLHTAEQCSKSTTPKMAAARRRTEHMAPKGHNWPET